MAQRRGAGPTWWGGASRGYGRRTIYRRAENGWRLELAVCGGAWTDLAGELESTRVPIIYDQHDGGPRGAYMRTMAS